ncbi:MAG: M23 family metallopeptidase [Alphaproteobacteria bacterium]|nr:MAG: M23 family metallopeptidase [Alphaproteobacteria bacterium]
MAKNRIGRHGLHGAVAVVTVCGLAVACSGIPADPAPVFMKGGAPGIAAAGPEPAFPVSRQITSMPRPAAAMPRETRQVTVQRGMSVGSLAGEYHVSKQAIIAANHLEPPYKIKLGFRLIIPGTAASPVQQAMVPAPTPDVIPLDDPPAPRASAPLPVAPPPAATLSAPRPPAPLPPPAPVAALRPPSPAPQPAPAPAAAPMPQSSPQLAAPSKPIAFPPREPSAAEEARAEAAAPVIPPSQGGGHFPWPLRGRVLASYGVATDGTHNDGINIAAARGTPIEAVEAGIVAYAGNELRGYGNLVLVKHANGWISAYAHCDELLVKKGDPVYRGKVIAKVGATGGVSEPQLHFELRQGKRPVDPRGFLQPAPSA